MRNELVEKVVPIIVKLRRAKAPRWFHSTVVGGRYDGKTLLLRSTDSDHRRWCAVARCEAMIDILIATDQLEADGTEG